MICVRNIYSVNEGNYVHFPQGSEIMIRMKAYKYRWFERVLGVQTFLLLLTVYKEINKKVIVCISVDQPVILII